MNDSAYDEEDKKRFRYIPPNRVTPNSPESKIIGTQSNATGNLLDLSEAAAARGEDWREKSNNLEESKYTRLGLDDDPDEDNLNKKTQYLFEYERDMNPLNQLQATKNLLNEAQRLAYVSMCSLVMKEMSDSLIRGGHNEVKPAVESMKHWTKLIIDRLCKHMDIESHERQMIQQLAEHGVSAEDLVECLITTQTVPNPNYDPDGSSSGEGSERKSFDNSADGGSLGSRSSMENAWTTKNENPNPFGSSGSDGFQAPSFNLLLNQNHEVDDDLETPKPTAPSSFPPHPGPPSTTETDEEFPNTLPGISQTISSSDEMMTLDIRWTFYKMGSHQQHERKSKVKRLVMMGAATIGGGLVIGLSAGLLAPVIGAGLAAGFTTIGIGGTSGFLAGAGGAAVITTAGTVTGMNIAGRGMGKRTQSVTTFKILPLHNNRRVNVFLTMPGFMEGANDDVRLPFSVMDQSMGDVGQQVLQATVLTALMSALQWPLMLTKLGYLIDNPWSNALARARAAGILLADILIKRHIGVRPVSLIGFSLGARAIFYALVELARQKAYGIVQEVYLLGATVTAPAKTWREIRGVVAGRSYDGWNSDRGWAESSDFSTWYGECELDRNRSWTYELSSQMPVVLAELGFKVTADHFDEPDAMEEDDAPEEETSALKTMKKPRRRNE
ncbi:hypothetical protein PSTT_15484 [Puccinia striiformis]|uniref:DUF726 domain protein n=1 Tax=Puccinia striiformis TaxID=27350 RepID=A0A2S4UHU8_9BASI|nr:hypothetical protein PSTT_15484 [Puccinia striiformis]